MILVTEVLCIKGLLIPAELLMQHRETLFQYGFSFEQLGYPPPVQPFQQRRQLRSRQVHHPVFDPGPAEDAVLQPFGEQTKSGAVPEDQLDPVRPLGPEHMHRAGERIDPHGLAHQSRQSPRRLVLR
jgi:hypothetical protein